MNKLEKIDSILEEKTKRLREELLSSYPNLITQKDGYFQILDSEHELKFEFDYKITKQYRIFINKAIYRCDSIDVLYDCAIDEYKKFIEKNRIRNLFKSPREF